MARSGKIKFDDLVKFRQKIETEFNYEQQEQFMSSCAKALAAELLRRTVKRTPVGDYPAGSGKNGGTLKGAWTIGKIEKSGGVFKVEVINPVEYASYVEYGHRTRGGKGWVAGRFMLTMSENEVSDIAPKLLERKLEMKLKEFLK